MYQERIKEIRTKLNLSVAKLADKIGIPARTITGYERGERTPSIEFLANLSTILNVNANWFITGNGEMFNKKEPFVDNEELEQKVVEVMKKYGVIKK
nr:MAG TPA: helix-turn-helix domain protein [Caudoviricetes sp.]